MQDSDKANAVFATLGIAAAFAVLGIVFMDKGKHQQPLRTYQLNEPVICDRCGKEVKERAHCFWMLPSGKVVPLHDACEKQMEVEGGD